MQSLIDEQKNWQKICAAEDYAHPDFRAVLEEVFDRGAAYHRKQWEFVVIYLNLLKAGKIHPESVGASFGAGREPLIYLITERVKQFTATDLYIYNTGWTTAKVDKDLSCRDFVLELADPGFPQEKLAVEEMDMRQLGFADDSLDFCYSSCAFEHIGDFDDFVSHLKEVKRVLKPDGVYVMTTEHLFCHPTLETKGNYKFSLDYLAALFEAADFYPQPVLDESLEMSKLNQVKPELGSLLGFNEEMINLFPGIILSKFGVPYTSSCFVFANNSQNKFSLPEAGNIEQKALINRQISKNIRTIYGDYKPLNPTAKLNKNARSVMNDHLEYLVSNHEDHFDVLPIEKGHFVYTELLYLADFAFSFLVNIELFESAKLRFKLVRANQLNPAARKVVETKSQTINGSTQLTLEHQAEPGFVYALAIAVEDGKEVPLKSIQVQCKVRS
jgi:SAM-dependent methyltransferase